MTHAHRFPRALRIRRRREFLAVQQVGRRRHSEHFVVIARRAASGVGRVGITVSSRVGNAVVRNRVKRLVREVFRLLGPRRAVADFVVIAKPGANRLRYAEVTAEIIPLMEHARG